MQAIVSSLYAFMGQIDERIRAFDRNIEDVFKASTDCQRIAKLRGVGPDTSTATIAAIGDGSDFKNGRHLAAWLGLVPRQHSSGERRVMMGISKRGSQHLRTLLVHGARAVVRTAVKKPMQGVCGSTNFACGEAITARPWLSPIRTHG